MSKRGNLKGVMRIKNRDLAAHRELVEGENSHLLQESDKYNHPQRKVKIKPLTAKFYVACVIWEYNDQLPVSVGILRNLIKNYFEGQELSKPLVDSAIASMLKEKILVLVQNEEGEKFFRITYLGTIRLNTAKRELAQAYASIKRKKNEREQIFAEQMFDLAEEEIAANVDLTEFELPDDAWENLTFEDEED